MVDDTNLDLVTGAFSHSGARIAETLLGDGRSVERSPTTPIDRIGCAVASKQPHIGSTTRLRLCGASRA